MSPKKETDSELVARELVITRMLNAPVKLVWKAWTETEHFIKWWGPKDYTCPASKIDFRVGGKFLHAMRSEDGQEYWSTGIYKEIIPLKKIVSTDNFSDPQGNVLSPSEVGMPGEWPKELEVTITFEDLGTKTKMTLHHIGIPDGVMNEMTNSGWNQSFDKMEKALLTIK